MFKKLFFSLSLLWFLSGCECLDCNQNNTFTVSPTYLSFTEVGEQHFFTVRSSMPWQLRELPAGYTFSAVKGEMGSIVVLVTMNIIHSNDHVVKVVASSGAEVEVTLAYHTSHPVPRSPESVTICPGRHSFSMTGVDNATGYLWQQSSDGNTWEPATGTRINPHYTTPVLSSNMYYRRSVTFADGTIVSSAALVTVLQVPCLSNSFSVSTDAWVNITVRVARDGGGNPIGDLSGTSTDSHTMCFMTYNLGANPALTPKQQMAFQGCPTDITVFGGWYQWGRKDATHTFRCDPTPNVTEDLRFTTERITNSGTAFNDVITGDDQGKFITTSASPWNWTVTHQNNSNLWGNGRAITDTPSGNVPTKGLQDPCPAGWRVPTQHEWALLGHEDGKMNTSGDLVSISASVTKIRSGLYWVRVSNGVVASSFNASSRNGYAIYDAATWEAVYPTPPDSGTSLISGDAPIPLLFLPATGFRDSSGPRTDVNVCGTYWSSTIGWMENCSFNLIFGNTFVSAADAGYRANGASVRCVKE